MKSLLLQGVHWLTSRLRVQVYSCDYWKLMPHLKSEENPLLKGGTKFFFTLPKALPERNHSRTFVDTPREGAVFQLVVESCRHCRFHVFTQNISAVHRLLLPNMIPQIAATRDTRASRMHPPSHREHFLRVHEDGGDVAHVAGDADGEGVQQVEVLQAGAAAQYLHALRVEGFQ